MLLLKQGFPEEDELVLCTVTNIHFHSVFAKLDEYEKTGLIHISEISPGRIRNIRDFVVEGKKVVCKVLRVDKKAGHIDLSLRRVNENQKRNKINEIKQEQKAEKIIEQVAKNNNMDFKKLYVSLTELILKKYEDIHSCFKDAVKKNELLEKLGIKKEIADQLLDFISVRFKEEDVAIGGTLTLSSFEPNGAEIIRKALKEAESVNENIDIKYKGGGHYSLNVTSEDYKSAEKMLDKAIKKATSFATKGLGTAEFKRKE